MKPENIAYRGQEIPISKSYVSYDDFKNDPGNIPKDQIGRVEQLLLDAPAPAHCSSAAEFVLAIGNIQFPGYGLSQMRTPQKDGTSIFLLQIEIPRRNRNRALVYQSQGSEFILLDDFVASKADALIQVVLDGDHLKFLDHQEKVVLRRPIRRPNIR